MRIPELTDQLWFPPPESADETGLLAFGGDTNPERLILAYSQGIFPWPSEGLPLLWFSPNPRFILSIPDLKIGRSLRKTLRSGRYSVSCDTRFDDVIRACRTVPRPGQSGTWITDEMVRGYSTLHRLGYAHSVETYLDGSLVGGLYGVSLGAAFFGESMYADAPDASKVALTCLAATLCQWGFEWIDCQMETDVFARLGAHPLPRATFLADLRKKLSVPTRKGPWGEILAPRDALAVLRPASA